MSEKRFLNEWRHCFSNCIFLNTFHFTGLFYGLNKNTSDMKWVNGLTYIFTGISHLVKWVLIRSNSGPHFSRIFLHSDWIQRDTVYGEVKMRTRITLNTDSFYAVSGVESFWNFCKSNKKYTKLNVAAHKGFIDQLSLEKTP